MTKTDLISRVKEKLHGATKEDIRLILEATEQVIAEVIKEKDRVPLLSFLYVSGEEKEPRMMRNPYTGGKIQVGKRIAPKALFTASFRKSLREEE